MQKKQMNLETVTVVDKGQEKQALVIEGRTVLVNGVRFEENDDTCIMHIDHDILQGDPADDMFMSMLGDAVIWILEKNVELGGFSN